MRATVARESVWLVTLDTASKTASGHRAIEATTCQGLANATALIVALMIDPDAVAARSGKAKGNESAPYSPSPPAVPEPEPSTPRVRGRRATHGFVGATAAGDMGVLPASDVGVSISAGIVRAHWRAEACAAYSPRWVQSETMADPPGAYGRFSFVTGTLEGCMTFARPHLEIGPCASMEFGAVRGQGVGASRTTRSSSPWLGLGVGGLLSIKANGWLYFPIHADAVLPLWRPNYVFQNVQTPIFQSWPVGGRLTAGVELRF